MATNDASILHLVNPIAGIGDESIMSHQKQRFSTLTNQVSQERECAFRVASVEVSGRFIGEDHLRIIGQCASNRDALLLPSGKVPAFASKLIAKIDIVEQRRGAIAHFRFAEMAEPPHRHHHVLLGGEILHQEMELENETDQLVTPT